MFPCDEANETSFNTMDHINPTLMSDNPPITPAGYLLTSAHSSPLNLFPSPPPSSRSPLVDTIPLNSQIGMDFPYVSENGWGYISPIRPNRFNRTIASCSPAPDEDIRGEYSRTTVSTVARLSPRHSSSNARQSPSPPPPPRRGRPCKAKRSITKHPVGPLLVKARREFHNNSAARSRARLNAMLDNLWSTIPPELRVGPKSESASAMGHTLGRELSRASQVEIAVSYIESMQDDLKSSSHRDVVV